jgi:hypothetical protein
MRTPLAFPPSHGPSTERSCSCRRSRPQRPCQASANASGSSGGRRPRDDLFRSSGTPSPPRWPPELESGNPPTATKLSWDVRVDGFATAPGRTPAHSEHITRQAGCPTRAPGLDTKRLRRSLETAAGFPDQGMHLRPPTHGLWAVHRGSQSSGPPPSDRARAPSSSSQGQNSGRLAGTPVRRG